MDKPRIIINGREYTQEEIDKLQEEYWEKYWEEWHKLRNLYDCNCAVVTDDLQIVYCGINKTIIHSPESCKQCAAYNNKDYSKEDIEADMVSDN